jgi:hypothetical protein
MDKKDEKRHIKNTFTLTTTLIIYDVKNLGIVKAITKLTGFAPDLAMSSKFG